MSHAYRIVEVRREPLPAGRRGVRVRARLTGCPSRRWSRGMSARLDGELGADVHLRLNRIVEGDQIVLESGEAGQATALAGALIRAVSGTNQARSAEPIPTVTVARERTDAIAEPITPAPHTALGRSWWARNTGDRVEPSRWFG